MSDTILRRIAREPFSDTKVNEAIQTLGELYHPLLSAEEFAIWQADYADEGIKNPDKGVAAPFLQKHIDDLFQKSPSQWAALALARPGFDPHIVEKLNQLKQQGGDSATLAEIVRTKGKTREQEMSLPANPTPDQALRFLELNYSPKTGLKGPPGERPDKQHADWALALDTVKGSSAHAYHFIFNVMNKPPNPPHRWEAAEDMLKKDTILWPYYVWSIPGLHNQPGFNNVPRPMSSEEVSKGRGVHGPSDKEMAEEMEANEAEQQSRSEAESDIAQALQEALEKKTQDHELETRISVDPRVAMEYFQKVLKPRGWTSDIISKSINSSRDSFHEDELEAFDQHRTPRKELTTEEALREAIAYAQKGKFFPELEAIIAKDVAAMDQYVVQALAPKGQSSEVIRKAIVDGIKQNPLGSSYLAVAYKWDKDMALKMFTDELHDLAASDPGKAIQLYDMWKGYLNSNDLISFMLEVRKKLAPEQGPHIFSASSIREKLKALWR